MLTYKVAETSDVSDIGLEKVINELTREGWQLDSIHFAMREASRRPAMAFLLFSRHTDGADDVLAGTESVTSITE